MSLAGLSVDQARAIEPALKATLAEEAGVPESNVRITGSAMRARVSCVRRA